MKSIKHSIELRQPVNKRYSSSRKALPAHTQRPPTCQTITKSNVAIFNAKDIKKNNFFLERNLRTSKTARVTVKKKVVRNTEMNKSQQLLLKKSDKMKMIFWNQDPALLYLKPIVISADYIVNQDMFWDKQQESKNIQASTTTKVDPPAMVKQWRQLHKSCFVIWVVRNRWSWAKIQKSVSSYGLPLHALFLIRKKRNYTVDYSCVVREMERQKVALNGQVSQNRSAHLITENVDDSLTIFQTVKVNTKDLTVYESYCGKIPVLLGVKAKVVLMRMEAEPPGLECINKSLQKWRKHKPVVDGQSNTFATCRMIKLNSARRRIPQIYPCLPIKSFIHRYLKQKQKEQWQQKQDNKLSKQQDWFYEQDLIYQKINQTKRDLIEQIISSQGRQYQFEGGLSIYNFVGEMFKRNHGIMFDHMVESMYATQRKVEHRQEFVDSEGGQMDIQVDYFQLEWK